MTSIRKPFFAYNDCVVTSMAGIKSSVCVCVWMYTSQPLYNTYILRKFTVWEKSMHLYVCTYHHTEVLLSNNNLVNRVFFFSINLQKKMLSSYRYDKILYVWQTKKGKGCPRQIKINCLSSHSELIYFVLAQKPRHRIFWTVIYSNYENVKCSYIFLI